MLPVSEPKTGFNSGFTPLRKSQRLANELGCTDLWIKDDSCNYPTYSYKERVVSVAISKAIEFGFDTVGCASTGNLANSTAAHAAMAGLRCFVMIPHDLEQGKVLGSLIFGPTMVRIRGTYDDVNRLCTEIADKYGWAIVNVNLRPYYTEGAKTYGFEIAEQLGWRLPHHTVVPMASGSLLTKISKAYTEFRNLGLVDADATYTVHGAQASGCAPIAAAFKRGMDIVKPVQKPETIAKSLAIGTPADGYYAIHAMRETGGGAEDCSDDEIVEGIRLLAECEGIFAETAGGVTVACARKLIENGKIPADDSAVLCITGNGLKTQEAILGKCGEPRLIKPSLREFEELIAGEVATEAAA